MKLKKLKLIIFIVCLILGILLFFLIRNNKINTCWKITQYGNDEGSQMMGYTIEGNKNGLIIVDGGYYNETNLNEKYKEIINAHDNIVDAWIITHFDSDHAGAYMALKESDFEFEVKKLYVQQFPDLEICKQKFTENEDWDIYMKYFELEESERDVVKVGDEDNIIGLKFKVLSVYEPWIGESNGRILNNGSIIFKLCGNKESILYCGDVTLEQVEKNMIEKFKDDLPSDYIQLPHHGNSKFSEEFYKIVNPKVAFFDAPTWLIENHNNVAWYTIEETRKMLETRGVQIRYFATTPNEVIMK